MKKNSPKLVILLVASLLMGLGMWRVPSAWAVPNDPLFVEIPFEFDHYGSGDLDWVDSDDDNNTGSTPLGFSVNIGGAAYSHFDMDSNGYIELLTDASDNPEEYGFGSISELIGWEPSATYILAAYDDLSSYYSGYYGYSLFPDKAVFYYDTETYEDEDDGLLNNFEVILFQSGKVQWNFNYANYDDYDNDLYSGLYFGNTKNLHELASDEIPEYRSFAMVPEPAAMLLFASGLIGVFGFKKRGSSTS